jgi:hypothetical protein
VLRIAIGGEPVVSAWVPENESSLVILSNDDSTDPQAIARELVRSRLWPAP